ncbi:MAG: hypothetical protein ACPG4W_00625 [Flavobacteriales bacterium]
MNSYLLSFSMLFALFSTISCRNNDDSDSGLEVEVVYKVDSLYENLINEKAYFTPDSNLVISFFSPKLPFEGMEDELEDVFMRRNTTITLNKNLEGAYYFNDFQTFFQVDTFFYSYSDTPYKIGSFTPDITEVEQETSYVYLKIVDEGRSFVTGNLELNMLNPGINPLDVYSVRYAIKFSHIPYSTYLD